MRLAEYHKEDIRHYVATRDPEAAIAYVETLITGAYEDGMKANAQPKPLGEY